MGAVTGVTDIVNYSLVKIDHSVKKIAQDLGAVRKVLQFATSLFAAIDLAKTGEIQKHEITQVMKGAGDLIKLYGCYKNLMYWIRPFSKETLDQEALKQSIELIFVDSLNFSESQEVQGNQKSNAKAKVGTQNKKTGKPIKKMEKANEKAEELFKEIMKETFYSKGKVLKIIQDKLQTKKYGSYNKEKAIEVSRLITIKQKERSPIELFYKACLTVADVGDNLLTLQKWKMLDVSALAASIGGQSRVFVFLKEVGVSKILGPIAIAGLVVSYGNTTVKIFILAKTYYSLSPGEDKKLIQKKLSAELISFISTTTDFAATIVPFVFIVNPPTVVALALISKGVGLVCFLAKD